MTSRFTAVLLAVGATLLVAPAPAAAGEVPVPTRDPDEVRDLAEQVVTRDEFRRPEPGLVDRARQRVDEWLGDLLGRAFSGSTGSLVGWAILALAIGAAVWFGTRFGRTVQVDRRTAVRVSDVAGRTPADWLAEAAAHEAAGEWKAALRCRYRALVGDLAAAEVLDEVAGRTAGEFRAEVRRRAPEQAPDFGRATDLFEAAWYGDEPTGAEEVGRFRTLADSVTGAREGAR